MRAKTYRFDRVFHPDSDGQDTAAPQSEMTGEMIDEIIAARVEAAVENARKEAYAEGHALGYEAGRANALNEQETKFASEAQEIARQIEHVANDLDRIERSVQLEAANTVTVLVKRLAPELLKANADSKIDSLVTEAITKLWTGGRLVVRVSPGHSDRVKAVIAGVPKHGGAGNAVEVVVDQSLAHGAVDIQWEGGGVGYDPKAIENDVNQAVGRVIQTLSGIAPENSQGADHAD